MDRQHPRELVPLERPAQRLDIDPQRPELDGLRDTFEMGLRTATVSCEASLDALSPLHVGSARPDESTNHGLERRPVVSLVPNMFPSLVRFPEVTRVKQVDALREDVFEGPRLALDLIRARAVARPKRRVLRQGSLWEQSFRLAQGSTCTPFQNATWSLSSFAAALGSG